MSIIGVNVPHMSIKKYFPSYSTWYIMLTASWQRVVTMYHLWCWKNLRGEAAGAVQLSYCPPWHVNLLFSYYTGGYVTTHLKLIQLRLNNLICTSDWYIMKHVQITITCQPARNILQRSNFWRSRRILTKLLF
jgi:hypothetical protein